MIIKSNISYIVKNNLCVGCGVCQDACPQKAITVEATNGVFRPKVDATKCVNEKGCHRCRMVCPGGGIKLSELANKYFGSEVGIKDNPYIGKYIAYYSGYSNNYEVRHESASGGMTSQFLVYLLEKGYIQGAVVTRFNKNKAFWVDTFIAKSKDDILSAKSSKYCPVTMAGLATNLKLMDGKFAIVGLPCHLHGLRKLAEVDKKLSNKIFAYVGLYCSCGRNFSLTEYVFNSRGIDMKNVKSFTYRRGAGMGKMLAEVALDTEDKKGYQDYYSNSETLPHNEIRIYEEGYQNYYLSLRSYFNLHRCMHCIDHFAELGDICFGDLHTGKYIEDQVGISSMVTRTEQMDSILHKMAKEGVVTIEPADKEDLLNSQKYVKTKKHLNPAYMRIDKIRGRIVPEYDIALQMTPLHKALKGYIVKTAQMFIGKYKSLHWIVRFMSKDMKNWK